jgi:hypothetical protein
MRVEIVIILITGFLIYNTYHNGKYTKMFFAYKKYFQMAFLGLLGVSIWLLIKRDPKQCKNILLYANNMVKYMPIDKSSMNMISPIVDFTNSGEGGFMHEMNTAGGGNSLSNSYERKILESGRNTIANNKTKRSVSETKKKYVASMQNWKCGKCNQQLNAWFEVDHKVRLEHGGGNEVENLVALCRDCHGRKTAMENM